MHAALVMNDDIIIIGGGSHWHEGHQGHYRALANGEMLKSGKQFDLRHGADRTCAVIVNENQFLVIGGYTDDRRIGGAITDPEDGQRYRRVRGRKTENDAFAIHGKVHRYDSEGRYLETLPNLNQRRADHACSTFVSSQGEQGVLVVGGLSASWAIGASSTEIFLPSSGRWVLASPLIGGKVEGVKAGIYNQQVLVFGGKGARSNIYADEIYAYDAESDTWTEMAKMVQVRGWHAITEANLTAVCLGNRTCFPKLP